MFSKLGTALLASAALILSADVVRADPSTESGITFQPLFGSNESSVQRTVGFGVSHITNPSASDFTVAASPTRNSDSQTVTIKGSANAGTNASCSVHSVTPQGTITITKSGPQTAGTNWTVALTFTTTQAPAANHFVAVCTLLAGNANNIQSISLSL